MALRRADPTRTAAVLVAAILVLDLLWSLLAGSTGTILYGVFDEPAHLATCAVALLLLVALLNSVPPVPFVVAALVSSVAIDVDHVPGYLGSHLLTGALPRPYTHSLLTIAVLLALVGFLRSEVRPLALGLALGIAIHLLRDLGTGPGVSLLWPFVETPMTIPYALYAGALVSAPAAIALTGRRRSPRPRPARPGLGARPLPTGGRQGGS